MPATAFFHSDFFIASSSSPHQIRFFRRYSPRAFSSYTNIVVVSTLIFLLWSMHTTPLPFFHSLPFFFSFSIFLLLLLFCFALSVTTRLYVVVLFFSSGLSLRTKVNDLRRIRNEWYTRMHIISTKDIAIHHAE